MFSCQNAFSLKDPPPTHTHTHQYTNQIVYFKPIYFASSTEVYQKYTTRNLKDKILSRYAKIRDAKKKMSIEGIPPDKI